jgi:hypothetical protein
MLMGLKRNLFLQPIFYSLLALSLAGCGTQTTEVVTVGPDQLFGPIGGEAAYCTTNNSPSPATTITSTATYRFRNVSTFGLGNPSTANIRYAEVIITNSAGTVVNCGETSSTGTISINIPRTAGTYTLKVNSRADNNFARASILNNPTAMKPYSISASFTLTGSETSKAVTLTAATYTDSLEGAAFNILDQIVNSNEFMRNNSTCPSLGNVCSSFSVAPKVRVFWTPGLSPGAYYGSAESAISFYIGNDESAYGMATGVYIMGGVNGSTCVDTDHYDNSVIIHEYGHFLEKAYAYSDSPGGSHNGNSVIDPRLAWSEGWSNFFQGAVRSESRYIDTTGNVDCTGGTGVNVNLNLESIISGQDAVSGSTYLGEGIFREVSVSRVLWDTMNSNSGGDNQGANVGFGYIWKIFSDSSAGFRNSSYRFRNIGHFNELMRSLISSNASSQLTAFDNLILNERQRSDRNEYAYPLTAQTSASCTFDIQGIAGADNLARSNDFFAYYFDGSSARSTLNLRYSATPSGTPSDLDLRVWNETYTLGDNTTLMNASERLYPESGGNGLETVSFSGKSAGWYLIQVKVDPDNVNTTARYYLETNGGSERLCP